jgi:AcrR family transcriptional regulator
MKESKVGSKRAANVAGTRQRILGAVREMLFKDGLDRLNITDLVKVAGVARSTVHYQFDSRQRLLEEVFREAVAVAEVDWLRPAREVAEAGEAVEAMIVQACRAWAADHLLLRRLMGLATVDLDANRAVQSLEEERERGIDELVKRLHDEQRLTSGCTTKRARSLLSLTTSFWTFDRLLEETLSRVEVAGILLEIGGSILSPSTWRILALATPPREPRLCRLP